MENERITHILERWFLEDAMLFKSIMVMGTMRENTLMSCPIRTGTRCIEYNPDMLFWMDDDTLAMNLRVEAMRILFRHPFERKPEGCCNQAITVGSNLTVCDNDAESRPILESPKDFNLGSGQPYEFYCRRIQEMIPPADGSGAMTPEQEHLMSDAERNRDTSALWEDDEIMYNRVNQLIDGCTEWGSIPGRLVEMLKASTRPKINWRTIMNGFKASIISADRELTRMRPSRRYGFDQMGVKQTYNNRVLVAVDTSASISSESLSYFYGVINSAFRFGFEIDVVQFDAELHGYPEKLRRASKNVSVYGRGGTSYDPLFEYLKDTGSYDGVIILTDGYAPVPDVPERRPYKILWVCDDARSYNDNHSWMEKFGRVIKLDLK